MKRKKVLFYIGMSVMIAVGATGCSSTGNKDVSTEKKITAESEVVEKGTEALTETEGKTEEVTEKVTEENTEKVSETEVSTDMGTEVETESVTDNETEVAPEESTEAVSEADSTETEEVSEEVESDKLERVNETEELTEASKTEGNTVKIVNVTLGDYSKFTYTKDYVEPSEEAVDSRVESLLSENSVTTHIEKGELKEEYVAVLSCKCEVDGKEVDYLTSDSMSVELSHDTITEGFNENLIGLKVGDNFDFTVKFPEDYEDEELAGKDAKFTGTISYAEEEKVPELTEEWVSKNTEYKSIKDLKDSIMKDLVAEEEEYSKMSAMYNLLDELYSSSTVEGYEYEAEDEFDQFKSMYEDYADEAGVTYEEYIKDMVMPEDDTSDYVKEFEDNLRDMAESNVVNHKIREAFAKEVGVDIGDQAFDEYLDDYAKTYGFESKEGFKESIGDDNYLYGLQTMFEESKVGEKLLEICTEVEDVADQEEGTETETELLTEIETEVFSEVETESDVEIDTGADTEVLAEAPTESATEG